MNAVHGDGHASLLVGDLNIAPLETDVWSHKQLLKVVSHTPIETEGLETLRTAWRVERSDAPSYSAERENLYLVELSRRRLGGSGSRTAAGSYLGSPDLENDLTDITDPSRGTRMGAPVGPCSGHCTF